MTDAEQRAVRVLQRLGELRGDRRSVIVLRYIHGFSLERVAGVLGLDARVVRRLERQGIATLSTGAIR